MGGLQYHQYYQQQQHILMTPVSVPCNLRATICIRSFLSKCFYSTSSSPKLCSKITAVSRVSAAELKDQWLNSLNCPSILNQTDPQNNNNNNNNNNTNNEEVTSNNVDSQSQWVIGIDPDVSGALAVLKPYHLGSSAQVYDSPNVKVLIGNRVRRRMDTKAMVELLRSLSIPTGTIAYIEQSLPYPGDGKQGWWSGGFNYGLWIGVLVASGVSVVPVPSLRWKQEFKLSGNGKTKDDSRALACSLFPTLSSSLKRKKDHGTCTHVYLMIFPMGGKMGGLGRAEALLIAAYGKGIRLDSNSESLTSVNSDSSNSDSSSADNSSS